MSSTAAPTSRAGPPPDASPVLFQSNGSLRSYVLNRPEKLNALNEPMLNILRPQVEEWCQGNLPGMIVGRGIGRAFCAGGDVENVMRSAEDEATRPQAINFFHREFEMDYILAAVPKPYVAVMDGITMGGGVGLAINAQFRIATEKTMFAMPETKIGYCPDVGANYFLSRVDGEIGTYLALTGNVLHGRAVFEHGFATHFVPSRGIPALLERLASLEKPTYARIDRLIEEATSAREPDEPVHSIVGAKRAALDSAFRHDSVENIFADLAKISAEHESEEVRKWAEDTLAALEMRSPTSLKVALKAVRKGKDLSLLQALQMEMNIATAICSGATPDFKTGVTAVLLDKIKSRPEWSPAHVKDVSDDEINEKFFSTYSPENGTAPTITPPSYLGKGELVNPMQFALPSENAIGAMVDGSAPSSGGTEITLDELLAKFDSLYKGKNGVKDKILEVVQRKCIEEPDKHVDKKWLKWKH